jgi:hypothetical protein
MGGKKIIFLFLALILPVLIFIFLRTFGKNEFNVPLIYAEGVAEIPTGCDYKYNAPYVLADTIVNKLDPRGNSLIVVNYSDQEEALMQLVQRMNDRRLVIISSGDPDVTVLQQNTFKNCALLLKEPNNVVVIDNQKQIRGYYDVNDRDELDRLQAELNILLQKY